MKNHVLILISSTYSFWSKIRIRIRFSIEIIAGPIKASGHDRDRIETVLLPLGRGGNIDIRPGDTIVVPLDSDKMRPLTFWTNVTQILYQGAIAVAAIKTFDN